jgi:hypothetical protein
VLLVAGLLIGAAPAAAQPAGAPDTERTESYDVRIEVRRDGSIHVQELIAYQVGGPEERHGIFRYIPVRSRKDFFHDRMQPLRNLSVRAGPGTPTAVKTSDSGNNRYIRIGDPATIITGRHSYTIDYDVEAAVIAFDDRDELNWDAIGTDWRMPVERSTVVVTGPARFTRVACYAGRAGSRDPCRRASGTEGGPAEFADADLAPGDGITVVLTLPKGVVAVAPPVVRASGAALAMAWGGGALFAGLAPVVLVIGALTRRRRRLASQPVEDQPAAGMRPAEMALLAEQRTLPRHLSATLVDLAVRGYLRIEHVEKERHVRRGLRRRERVIVTSDWKLTMLSNAQTDLLAFERALLSSVFKGRAEARMGASGASSSLSRVRRALGRHGVSRGWFTAPPQMFRGGYLGVCVVLVFVGAGGALIGGVQAVEPGADSPVTLIYPMLGVGLALLLPGIVVGVWGWSHRVITPKGEAALANVTAFRTFITSATPPPRDEEPASGGAGDGALDRYLPYAIAFGVTDRWAGLMDARGAATVGWFHGSGGGFGEDIDSFTTTTSGAVIGSGGAGGYSGGGGVGGGGGGGGGGGW